MLGSTELILMALVMGAIDFVQRYILLYNLPKLLYIFF